VWGIACVVLTNAISLSQPQVLRLAVDNLYRGVTAEKLASYATILFAIAIVGGLFKYLMRKIVIGISREIELDLRNDLFAHLQKLPLVYFQRTRTGEIMARADERSRGRPHDARPRHPLFREHRDGRRDLCRLFAISPAPRSTP
jgi:ABC-type multidrug transport system fused ATPase/permease subunit